MKYRAFISYSHADRKWARWLHRSLESYRLPTGLETPGGGGRRGRLRPIFRDRDELPSAADLSGAVEEALEQSETLIVVCSPNAAASQWVNAEITTFRNLGRSHRILCYIVAGEPGGSPGEECFPAALIAPEEGLEPLEPVAADARRIGDGRQNAMLKIAAGILGVGFDSLKQREHHRRQRRLGAIAAGSLLISAVTIMLAFNAVIARNEAQARRAQAEDLIDFMLGDLQEQLHRIGRIDVFQSVGDKALEYFAAQKTENESDRTLSQRAKNLRQIGNTRMSQGNQEAALEAFNESLLISEHMAQRAPQDAEAQIAMANSLFYVGFVHWQRGELRKARGIFESIIPIVESVSAREPGNPEWLAELSYANTNLGRVLELEGAYAEALTAYVAVMEVNERLLQLEPDNFEWQVELGFAHNNLGKLYTALGRLDDAESHYRTDLKIKALALADNPGHNLYRDYLGVSQYYLGELLVNRGDYAEAEELLAAAHTHFLFLVEVDTSHKRWRSRQADIERELGKLYMLTGRAVEGSASLTHSITGLEAVLLDEQANAQRRRDLLRSLLLQEDFRTRSANATANGQAANAIRNHIGILLEQEPGNLDTMQLIAYADICEARTKPTASSTALLQSTLDQLEQYFPETRNPPVLVLKSEALSSLGRTTEAAAINENLAGIGYKGLTARVPGTATTAKEDSPKK